MASPPTRGLYVLLRTIRWWGDGEVCGEVLDEHLTIRNPHGQRVFGRFGEVSGFFVRERRRSQCHRQAAVAAGLCRLFTRTRRAAGRRGSG